MLKHYKLVDSVTSEVHASFNSENPVESWPSIGWNGKVFTIHGNNPLRPTVGICPSTVELLCTEVKREPSARDGGCGG